VESTLDLNSEDHGNFSRFHIIQKLLEKEMMKNTEQVDHVGHDLIMTGFHILEIPVIYMNTINNCCYFLQAVLRFPWFL
jgi:hypothetical protein